MKTIEKQHKPISTFVTAFYPDIHNNKTKHNVSISFEHITENCETIEDVIRLNKDAGY